MMQIRIFHPLDEAAVVSLWRECDLLRPWNDPHRDIRYKLQVQPEMFLVGVLGTDIVVTVMAGYEGHRGWINYLAVSPRHRGKGFGRAIMAEAERMLKQAGCPKINLQVRASNRAAIGFYERLGYRVDEVVSLGKCLRHDEET